ncbi:MAG TPA: TolC family protein [Thermoanaerobaculia bacterium]|nr:TolC family protein [Thermoanaerobaculia bacterium]
MRIGILSLLALLCLRGAAAEEAPRFTEEEFLARVEAHAALAIVLTEEREVAAAEGLRTSLWPNPRLVLNVEEPGRDLRETTLALTWAPPRGRALAREAAAEGLLAADRRSELARFRLRQQLRSAWADWAFRVEQGELLAGQLAILGPLLEQTRARARAGEVAGLAARRLALEEAQLKAQGAQIAAAVATARARVAAWWPGLGEDARPVALGLLPALGSRPEPSGRADLAVAEHEVARAEALLGRSRQVLEAPELGLGWKRIEEGPEESSGAVLSLAWSLPVGDRRQADRREAEARVAAARARLDLARRAAEAELSGAWEAREHLHDAARQAEEAAAEVEALLAGATAAYRAGEADLTDLLDALRGALAARETALDLRESAWAAHRDLEAAAGRPLPGDLP